MPRIPKIRAQFQTLESVPQYFQAIAKEWMNILFGESLVGVVFLIWWALGNPPLVLIFVLAALVAGYYVWRSAQLEIARLKDRPYDSAQLQLVKGKITKLGSDERDVLRYLAQFGEREQSRIFSESGLQDAEFGPIFDAVSKTNLLNREPRQKAGSAGIDYYWWINSQFVSILRDELFPRQEPSAQRCFLSA